MEKKFYEMPEVKVINLLINGALLVGSGENPLDPDEPAIDPTPVDDPDIFG